jgi:argonaute-like protein implicated in RNA metabolism and viral defense
MNWQKRDHVRLVFHAFKPLKDAEVEAVMSLMAELGDYDVDYAFIHVVENHPYLLFDMRQPGVSSFGSRTTKGALAPTRGWFFRLTESEILLCLTGARELKRADDGMPWPVLLRLHRGSTFKDTSYLAKQMFAFSAHSWRSFFPSALPVTVLYSELVAKLLGQMSQIPWWNPDAMLGRIGETRWFL